MAGRRNSSVDQHQTEKIPRFRDMIEAAKQLSEDMTVQIRSLLRIENEQNLARARKARGGRAPLAASAWVPPSIKDVCISVIGLGHIGAPIVDLLVRSGLRNMLLIDCDIVRNSDMICGVMKPAYLNHSKAQAVKLAMLRLDEKLSVESMTFNLLDAEGASTLHHSLLTSDINDFANLTEDKTYKTFSTGDGRDTNSKAALYRRKKINLVVCCVKSSEVRSVVMNVCRTLSIPMIAVRVLETSPSQAGSSLNSSHAQGTVEFVLPNESKLFEPKDDKREKTEGTAGNDAAKASREVPRNIFGEPPRNISAKLEPLGPMLAGIAANEILRVIMGHEVPTFLRYDFSTGMTSTRLPKH